MKKLCEICNGEFETYRENRRTCGVECGLELRKRKRRVVVDGKMQCAKCGEWVEIVGFYFNHKTTPPTPRSYCKQCDDSLVFQIQKRRKQQFVELKGGKCQECGYDKCIGALEFHHIDPTAKEFTINKNYSIEHMKDELDKCVLLCANCHREKHFKGL